ncbi:AraC family transcriptional regulator [Aquabacter spiritensis]|uniref:AraC-like DNA-binding protein n=1 Tax=Aquabacter spiritensis TaxID=933073 RepID=A0A4R3LWQ4_9HYPH|nr:AraC family transcriptional regulator [Aquabacter spiritensis]TCT04576.1 AraC-like DNA-binding protein [Aquabacter spiritensis]
MREIQQTAGSSAAAMELIALAKRHAVHPPDAEGLSFTRTEGIELVKAEAPSGHIRTIYRPLICLVLQGEKEVLSGDTLLRFGAGQSLMVNVDVPVTGRVVTASRHAPYLAVAIELDAARLREVMGQMEAAPASPGDLPTRILVEKTDGALLDCALRLVRLLDHPQALAVLRAPILQEMHYWLLAGRHGGAMRRLAMPDGHTARIARAVAVLRADYARPMRVEELAAAAGMSPSSFHQHFKAVTTLSPLQFQKQLRLLEARRLLLAEGRAVSHSAFAVGYESASQFSRDYARMFGAPPRRDLGIGRAVA